MAALRLHQHPLSSVPVQAEACRSAFPLPLFKAWLCSCAFLPKTLAFLPFRLERFVFWVFKFLLLCSKFILSATFLGTKTLSGWLRVLPKRFLSIFGLLPSSSCLACWQSSFASVGSFISSWMLSRERSFPLFGTRKHVCKQKSASQWMEFKMGLECARSTPLTHLRLAPRRQPVCNTPPHHRNPPLPPPRSASLDPPPRCPLQLWDASSSYPPDFSSWWRTRYLKQRAKVGRSSLRSKNYLFFSRFSFFTATFCSCCLRRSSFSLSWTSFLFRSSCISSSVLETREQQQRLHQRASSSLHRETTESRGASVSVYFFREIIELINASSSCTPEHDREKRRNREDSLMEW